MATDVRNGVNGVMVVDVAEPTRRSPFTVVATIAVAVALLLLGAAGGMLLTSSDVDRGLPPDASSVDVGFAQDMSAHHLQAVTMAGLARERGTDPAIRTIAMDIESTQQSQVGSMRGWLALWNQPSLPGAGNYMAWMSGSAEHDDMTMTDPVPAGGLSTMPGMATTEELDRLRGLTGAEFEVYFLQLMLRHHIGGASMARYAAEQAEEPAVRALANSIAVSQSAEVNTMESMLTQRGARPL